MTPGICQCEKPAIIAKGKTYSHSLHSSQLLTLSHLEWIVCATTSLGCFGDILRVRTCAKLVFSLSDTQLNPSEKAKNCNPLIKPNVTKM